MSAAANVTLMVAPDGTVTDSIRKISYTKGRFLGKGGFAKCYMFTRTDTNVVYAGKVVPKAALKKESQRNKMTLEVEIHRSLQHRNIVKFEYFFEDSQNCFVVLEICTNKSLMELHRRRKTITEPECRYYVHQICDGVSYLHDQRVIHRDLKLGNIFLSHDMIIKLGDFGLASRINVGEKRKTLCGTPNYIAPEILNKSGHSYEVDIWSIGCIIYTFLVGSPPFETRSLTETYSRIKRNDFRIPSSVCTHASKLIRSILQLQPNLRPTVRDILECDFLQDFTPTSLPPSCLTMAPRMDVLQRQLRLSSRHPLGEHNPGAEGPDLPVPRTIPTPSGGTRHATVGRHGLVATPSSLIRSNVRENLNKLFSSLNKIVHKKATSNAALLDDDFETPSSAPLIWISKWVDYSDKYGLGYELSDGTIAVSFNDSTRLTCLPNKRDLMYLNRHDEEKYFTIGNATDDLKKKIQLLEYFRDYMHENLLKMGEQHSRPDEDLSRVPVMQSWFRSRSAIIMFLSNGTFQLNFFPDHTKLIICPLLMAVTYVDAEKVFHTYAFETLMEKGANLKLFVKLEYAMEQVQKMASQQDAKSRGTTPSKSNPRPVARAATSPWK